MRFELERQALLKPLQAVIGVVERRQTLPVLSNVLLDVDGDHLNITATDLEVELRAGTPVEGAEAGQITVPARKLVDIVRNLPDTARVELTVQGDRAVVRAAQSRFTLATLPAGDFPTVEEIGDVHGLELSQSALRRLIDKTHFSMALQDVRYYLNGLLLELEPTGLRAVATDGHRLALSTMQQSLDMSEPKQVIVPRKGVQELLRLLDHSDDSVHVELGENHVRVALPELRFTSKLIDGRFPDYQRVIPEEGGYVVALDRETLRQALVRASILSNEKYRGVRFVVDENRLIIQSNNPEQEEAEEEVSAGYDGPALEVGFNASYMLDALAAVDEEQVDVALTDANSSALIRGRGNTADKYVVMPMRL
ncbi:DNA polymerase III subunit beta [Ectothiorhodospiraceae bacterium WFHF3C12]|nr:DNA polymerase III subunit beta [Ectothiorhodospiraceae bacterium WFHF3C12]